MNLRNYALLTINRNKAIVFKKNYLFSRPKLCFGWNRREALLLNSRSRAS